jgi:hypothetical protein
MTGFDRRSLLLAGAATATGALLPARAAVAEAGPATQPPMRLFADTDQNFQALFAMGAAGYGAAEYGEVTTAVDAANAAGATYDAVYDAFAAMGERVAGYAEASARAGDTAAARGALLRSATYLALPLYFVLGTSGPGREAAAYRAMDARWNAAARRPPTRTSTRARQVAAQRRCRGSPRRATAASVGRGVGSSAGAGSMAVGAGGVGVAAGGAAGGVVGVGAGVGVGVSVVVPVLPPPPGVGGAGGPGVAVP